MTETEWVVTLSVRMTVRGERSKDEAVKAAIEAMQNSIRDGKELSMQAVARRMTNLTNEEPLFGITW
ncbi:hypothetical protein ABH15_00525 [Methanoculleus taiwanensis]|uniref:Uncharacterized protein n=1 Tax=Methanoculleus taiwanensis TaxID=1550565 RepID=A0A498H4A7_9EURY|nr:hypothetical protein [Methanoculleus taiwanensis]RXE56704.1 hypothetical protein ABH15_00525 [Methanoculleus taiwanensis]